MQIGQEFLILSEKNIERYFYTRLKFSIIRGKNISWKKCKDFMKLLQQI